MKNMNFSVKYLIILIFGTLVLPSSAQNIVGLWKVVNVNVGDEIMTPVAKWTRINEDGTYQSGNGWLQNAEGVWTLESGLFAASAINGLKDEFGAFTLEVTGAEMEWVRNEDGAEVVVSLKRIEELPKSTADGIVGLWSLSSILENDEDITNEFDPDRRHYLFIRWDRIYRERTSENERVTGYWHINGHRPDVTLLSHETGRDAETWRVRLAASDSELRMIGISETNRGIERNYQRLTEFPK